MLSLLLRAHVCRHLQTSLRSPAISVRYGVAKDQLEHNCWAELNRRTLLSVFATNFETPVKWAIEAVIRRS